LWPVRFAAQQKAQPCAWNSTALTKGAAVRMEQHCANARHLAFWLAEHPRVERIS
jgi:O-acetylhomoserine/O-acetylserine sulfhydrylase-like pyridoxal-dependent enzyme